MNLIFAVVKLMLMMFLEAKHPATAKTIRRAQTTLRAARR